MRYWYLYLGIILIALLTSCGADSSENEKVGLESARDSNSRAVATLPNDATDEIANENNQLNLENTLVYTTEFGLYLWDLAQAEPEKIDLTVDPEHVYVDPEQNYLVVGVADGSSFSLYKIDLHTHEASVIVQLSDFSFFPRWSIQSWSPNGEWFLINAANVGAPLGFVRMDGSLDRAIKIADDWRQTYWTNENKLLLIEIEDQFRTTEHRFMQVEGIQLFDPSNDTSEDLSAQIDLDFINEAQDRNEQYERLMNALDSFDIASTAFASSTEAPRINIQSLGEQTNDNLYCGTWRIGEWDTTQSLAEEPTRVLYEFENTALLTDFNQLPDGSILFIHGWYPDCEYGKPQGELIHMQSDGTYEVLSEHIMSAGDTSAFNGHLGSIRYLVAPNGESIIWIHQGENGTPEEQTLYVTDLASGKTAQLLVKDEPIHSIEEILWIES